MEPGKIIGEGVCPVCGAPAQVKANKKRHLYIYCVTPADGGCASGLQSRSDKADGLISARITKWRDSDARGHYLALAPSRPGPAPAPAPEPAPEPEPAPSPEPGPAPPAPSPPPPVKAPPRRPTSAKRSAWWDEPLF